MGQSIQYKTDEQIIKMREAGLVVAQIHAALRQAVKPGVTTDDMDQVALDVLRKNGSRSNFLGYYGFPRNICTSVNEEIVHGIPGPRVLEPGDLVSFDCGAIVDGWHADACISVVVPGGDPALMRARQELSDITRHAMWVGIAAMATGRRVGDIGDAIDDYVEELDGDLRPDIVLDFTGHGIGDAMHQEPEVLNYSIDARTPKLKPGMVLCIEPMLTAGAQDNHTLADEWTVVTDDGKDACHWEHMVALHKKGIWVLTEPDGGASELARFGVSVAPLS
ncbi:type I methionyl aminopeptidase [Arcanobacterium pinnipediorum]|uniref:Methionine aminopeptidase n=1 Tax=Arcanobacterium pinnipediorum TaxID=1503041 RepID=A0ABY5AG81_9ACTO|nr:type I methionyl aminopeptidase [Arcanobacterium pinnipediorum]USR79072.1 type I methionyl aminopeptidase [Arcanobacterium pinnipediorum]